MLLNHLDVDQIGLPQGVFGPKKYRNFKEEMTLKGQRISQFSAYEL